MSNVRSEIGSAAAETPPGALSTTSPAHPPKSQRVLACVLCQQRKVKCNRTFPCTNCVKAGAKCVPAALVRRPRKRRFPERELLDRLRQYEDLLRQNNVSFQPLHKDTDRGNESSKYEDYSDDDHPKAAKSNESSPFPSVKPEMVEAKEFWHTLKQVFRDQYNDNDTSHEVVREPGALEAWNRAFETSDHFLLGSSKTKLDLSIVHPDPAQIFKLWQVYMDNVDPLLKATHNPSLQARIVEATGNIAIIDGNLEALMFSIYCISVQSLVADDCWALFGWSKEDLLSRYQFGCRQALSNSSFLQTDNRDCLTALYLYLVSVGRRTHPRALSSILGSAIRIAQRMGIDREAECAKLPPFEAEMSRRLWWSLMLFDSRVSVLAGHKSSTLSPTWDCRVPLNLNDSDIRPGIKEIPRLQGATTEALFAVVRSEVGDFIRRTTFHLNFTSPILKPLVGDAHPLPERDALIAFEKSIEKRYFDFCDPENPLHFMTIWTVRAQLAKSRLVEHHSMFSDPSVQQTDAQYDIAISHAFNMLECDTKLFTSPLNKGYLWFLDFHFPFMAYVHIVQDLKRRPASEHVQRAWSIMSDNYDARFPITGGWETSLFAFFSVFTKTILRTWEDQEAELKKRKVSMETPRIISSIRLGATKVSENTLGSVPQQSSGDMDLDVSNFSLPLGVGLGDLNVPYDVNEQDGYSIGITGSYPGITEGARADSGLDQMNWPSMAWGLDER